MTQYKTDFSEYTTGLEPSDWTKRWDVFTMTATVTANATAGDSYGDKYLRIVKGTDAKNMMYSWDDIDGDANRDDVEILFRARMQDIDDGNYNLAPMTRGAGADIATMSNHKAWVRATTLFAYDHDVGSVGEQFSFQHYGNNNLWDNQWYWCRFRSNGSTHQMKLWKDTKPEPEAWNGEYTSSTPSAAGWVGFGLYDADNTYIDIDYFCAATNGETAEFPDEDAAVNLRVSSASLQVLHTETAVELQVDHLVAQVLQSLPPPQLEVDHLVAQVLQSLPTPQLEVDHLIVQVMMPNPDAVVVSGQRSRMFVVT